MSSTPVQEYAILDEVKFKLNIDTSDLSQDVQITVATNDSNNYIAEQTAVHATVIVAGNDPSLSSMANNLAAAYFNFWISTEKDREELERWQDRIQQYIMAKYGKKSANMLSGEDTIGVTRGFVSSTSGTSSSTTISSPLTTKGDIFGFTTIDARIPVGADTLILTADSSDPLGVSWQVPGGGTGDVIGPTGATDNAIARYDTTTGKLIQNSGVLIDDFNNVTGVLSIAIGSGTWVISEDVSDELLFTSPIGDGNHGIKVVSDTGEILLQNTVSTNDYTSLLSTEFTDVSSTTTAIAFSIQSNITTASDGGTEPITQIQGKANGGSVTTRPIFGFYNFTTKLWEINNDGTVNMQGNSLGNAVLTTPTITDFTNAIHDHANASGGGTLIATNALTATGTKDSTTFLRGDDTWAVPPGGGGSQTPWLTDIDADGFDLTDLKNIEFRNVTGTAPGIAAQAIFTTTTFMRFNVPTNDIFEWGVNGSTDLTLSADELNLQSNTLGMGNATSIIWAANANRRINNSTTGFIFEVESSDNFDYQIASASQYTFDANQLDLHFNNLVDMGTGTISALTDIGTPVVGDLLLILDTSAGIIKSVNVSNFGGITTINSDTAAIQTLTGGTGINIIDSSPDHSFAIDSTVVTQTGTQGLTNKTIDADNNTISNLVIGAEVTGASTALTDTATIAYLNTANTYNAGTKQSFVAGTTNAGINLNAQLPSSLAAGDIYRTAEVLHFIGTTATDYTLVSNGQPTTYTAGVRQDFLGATGGTAGLRIVDIVGTPNTQTNGDIWYDSTAGGGPKLFGRINGVDVDLGAGGGTGLTSINTDTTAAQIIAAGTGLGIVDATNTHTLSVNNTVVVKTSASTYTAGVRQDFLGLLAGTAGLNIGGIAGTPNTQVDGDIWLDTSTNQIFGRINNVDIDLGAGGGTGLTSINTDTTAAQIIAAGTGLGIVDATNTHTLSINSSVVTLTGTQDLTNKTFTGTTNEFENDALIIQNPLNTFNYLFETSAIIDSNKTVTLPVLITSDTFVFEDHIQSLTNKSIAYSGRAQWNKGSNVASASIITLGTDGNIFTISAGTSPINEILATGWQAGSVIILEFDTIVTVTSTSGGTNDIILGDGVDYTTTVGDSLELWFDGTDWHEISRSNATISFPINFPQKTGGNATATQDISFAGNDRHSQQFTLTQNTTLTFSGTVSNTTEYLDLFIVQDAAGGWTLTLPAGTINKAQVESAINLGAGEETFILLKFAFGTFYAFIQGDEVILPVNRGGTGNTIVNQGGVLFGSSSTLIDSTTAGTEGQLLVSHGTSPPTFQNSSLQNTVIVRSAADFPDAILGTYSDTVDTGGFTEFQFAVAHNYSVGQRIEVLTDSSVPGNIGFHTVTAIDTLTLVTDFAFISISIGGTTIRVLAKDTNYVLATPITNSEGYRYEDGANLSITSTNRYVNTIEISAGSPKTFLSGRNIGTIELDVVVTDTTGTIFPPAPGIHKLFDIVGGGNTFSEILFTRNCRFEDFGDLGNISGISIGFLNTLFVEYTTGLIVNFAFLNVSRIVAFSDIADSVFITLDNAGLSPFGAITVVFSGNTFNLQNTTANLFDIKPDMNPVNTVVITNSSGVGLGNFFKPSTGLTGPITAIRSTDKGDISAVTDAALNIVFTVDNTTGLANGDFIVINGTTAYDQVFTVISFVADTSITVAFADFTINTTGTWDKISDTTQTTVNNAVVTATNTLTDGQSVEITDTINSEGISLVSASTASTFQIPNFSNIDSTGTFKQARVITVIADNNTNTGSSPTQTDVGGGVVRINAVDIGTTLVNGNSVTITGGAAPGTFTISNVVDNVSFDVTSAFGTSGTATWTEDLIDLTITNHGLTASTPILVDKTINYDSGYVIDAVTTNTITINAVFVDTETSGGLVFDGSLNQSNKSVLINTVSGEIDSKAKGSFSMDGNSTVTVLTEDIYSDLVLFGTTIPATTASDVVEASDTELFRLTNSLTGELEYRGIEPFSGQFAASIVVGSANNTTLAFRAVKNSGVMIDGSETTILGVNAEYTLTFIVSVTAVTGDKFKLQIKNTQNSTDVPIKSLTTVIQ